MSAIGQPACGTGIHTLRPGPRERMSAVSAMKRTPQKTMRSAREAAARRESSSESPTASQCATISLG